MRLDVDTQRTLWGLTRGSLRLLEEQPRGTVKLYDITNDPGEQRDLANERPELVAELQAQLAEFRGGLVPVEFEHVTVDLTEALNEQLEQLGYVGDE